MSNRHKNPAGRAGVEKIGSLDLLRIHDGHKEIGSEKQYSALELRRRYTNDGERILVQLNRAAHHPTIILEMRMPISIRQHDIWGAVCAVLIRAVEEAAYVRLNAQCVEVISAHFIHPGSRRVLARVQPDRSKAVGYQSIETVVAIAQVQIVRVGLERVLRVCALNLVEAFRLRHIQRSQDQRIQYAKDDGVCTDGH